MSSGTYVKLVPNEDTRNKIALILKMFNIENYTSSHDLHVTVLYSRKECPNIEHSPIDLPIKASGIAFSIFPNSDGGNCLVIELGSDEMQSLHSTLKEEHGATHDYDSYKPHITLSYDYSNNPLPGEAMLEHFWNLTFDQFMVEPLTFNCVSN